MHQGSTHSWAVRVRHPCAPAPRRAARSDGGVKGVDYLPEDTMSGVVLTTYVLVLDHAPLTTTPSSAVLNGFTRRAMITNGTTSSVPSTSSGTPSLPPAPGLATDAGLATAAGCRATGTIALSGASTREAGDQADSRCVPVRLCGAAAGRLVPLHPVAPVPACESVLSRIPASSRHLPPSPRSSQHVKPPCAEADRQTTAQPAAPCLPCSEG